MKFYCVHEDRPEYAGRKAMIILQYQHLTPKPTQTSPIWITSYPATWFTADNPAPENVLHTATKATEKSCFWKHIDVLRQIAADGETGLVLEDDALFQPDLLRESERLLEGLPADFYVNIEYASEDVPLYYLRHRWVKVKGTRRTGGYLVSPTAAAKLVALVDGWVAQQQTFFWPADYFITEHYAEAGIETFWAVKPLVFQGSKTGRFDSDLSQRARKKSYGLYEALQRNCMPWINKIRACFLKSVLQRIERS